MKQIRKLLPIPTVAVWALGLILVGAGVFSDNAARWWIGASGLAFVGLVAAKETILWCWRRDQLREELAGQRKRAEQGLAAEPKRAEQALANTEHKRTVASRQTKIIADLQARFAATQKQKKPPGDKQNAGIMPRRIAVLTASLAGGGAERLARMARLRRTTFVLFVGGILAYGAAFAGYMLNRFDLVNMLRDVTYDDSFYYFQVASRMAAGEFSTFDGITRTNGYHPLWLFLITPFYWVLDKTAALFAIKSFEIMLIAGGVALVAAAARVARLPWVLLFAVLPAIYQTPGMLFGLEAAAGLFFLGLFLLAVCLFARDPAGWRWSLAAVAFALPWVRLEYVAVSVATTAMLWFFEWSRGKNGRRSVHATTPLFGAVAGILVYFTWNAVLFGGSLPVSGATKKWWSQRLWEREGGYSMTENFHAYLQNRFFDDELLIALEICVYVVVVWFFSRRSRGLDDWLLLAFLAGVCGLAAEHLAKFAHSVLVMHPRYGTSYGWYFVPAYLMAALAVPVRCCVAIWLVRRFVGGVPLRGFRMGIVLIGVVHLFVTADFTGPFRFINSRASATDQVFEDFEVSSYMGTMVMNRLLPAGSVVGSYDAGLIGYFSRFPVINLHGLVNSWDYLRAQVVEGRRAGQAGTEAAFRQRHGITHIANVGAPGFRRDTMLLSVPLSERRQFSLWLPDSRGENLQRESSPGRHGYRGDRAAWFWERMEPHLERRADGVGLLVVGRLAQAFVRDCAPDDLAVWNWGADRRGGTKLVPWTQMTPGICTSAVVLPPDALPPVRAWTVGRVLADRVGGRRPALRSDFDVYLLDDTLVYAKELCVPEDVDATFFLHVDPIDPDDLPGPRRRYGFDNLDFRFDDRGSLNGGVCVAEVPLPEYGVAAIRTGQYVIVEGGFHHPWEGEIRVVGLAGLAGTRNRKGTER